MVWANYNDSGKLAVTWRDRRNSDKNGFWNAGYDFYYAISSDNGLSFSKNQKLSSQFVSFDSILTQNGNDMMCSAYINDTLYATWGDTRTGKLNIFFSKTIISSNTTVNISQLNELNYDWFIFPNPSSELLSIQLPNNSINKELSIIDLNGKVVYSKLVENPKFSIQINFLNKGLYFIKYGNEIKKFLKE